MRFMASASQGSAYGHPVGMKKGMVYSGTFMGILYGLDLLARFLGASVCQQLPCRWPCWPALLFPLAKTIIETFDGSQRFFHRVQRAIKIRFSASAVVGLGWACRRPGIGGAGDGHPWFGFAVGVAAFAGVNFVRDLLYGANRGRVQSWRPTW